MNEQLRADSNCICCYYCETSSWLPFERGYTRNKRSLEEIGWVKMTITNSPVCPVCAAKAPDLGLLPLHERIAQFPRRVA